MTVGNGAGDYLDLDVPTGNVLKILGVKHYINVKDKSLEDMRTDLAFYCNVITRKPASAPTKIIALTASVYQKICYKAQFSALSYKETMQLDVPINQFYRRVTKNMLSFPTKLLYSECSQGGLGFRRLSDEIQQRKLNNLLSGLHQDADTKDAYESHLYRAMRIDGYRPLHGQGSPVDPIDSRFWAASLLDAFEYAGLKLQRGGDQMIGTAGEQLQARYQLTEHQSSELKRFGVYTVGDVTQQSENGVLWRDFSDTPLEFINRLENDESPPQEPPIIGIHTMWRIADGHVAEILGIMRDDGQFCVRIWIPIGLFRRGGMLRIHTSTPSRGAGTPLTMSHGELFMGEAAHRVITYPDEVVTLDGNTTVTRRILSWATTAIPRVHTPCQRTASPFANTIATAMAGRVCRVYTDGSYKALHSREELLFSEPPAIVKHGASLVLIPEDHEDDPIVFHISHHDSLAAVCAFPMELIPLTLALELATIARVRAVHSDCESIVKWISREKPRLSHTRCTSILLTAAELRRATEVEIHHCAAHAEKGREEINGRHIISVIISLIVLRSVLLKIYMRSSRQSPSLKQVV
jgi:hypothetical protein